MNIKLNLPTSYVLFAHGSSVETANASVRNVAAELARAGGYDVEPAFLEQGQPDLGGAIAILAARGVKKVVVIPYFLTLGIHLQRDLPRIASEATRIYPDVDVTITPPLDGHPSMLQILLDRAAQKQA
jgi:sirohydrochlorin ferrochelatase